MRIDIPSQHLIIRDYILNPRTFKVFDSFIIDENFLCEVEKENRILSIETTTTNNVPEIRRQYRFFENKGLCDTRTRDYLNRYTVEAYLEVKKLDI